MKLPEVHKKEVGMLIASYRLVDRRGQLLSSLMFKRSKRRTIVNTRVEVKFVFHSETPRKSEISS